MCCAAKPGSGGRLALRGRTTAYCSRRLHTASRHSTPTQLHLAIGSVFIPAGTCVDGRSQPRWVAPERGRPAWRTGPSPVEVFFGPSTWRGCSGDRTRRADVNTRARRVKHKQVLPVVHPPYWEARASASTQVCAGTRIDEASPIPAETMGILGVPVLRSFVGACRASLRKAP